MPDWLAEAWAWVGAVSDSTEHYVLSYADSVWVYVGLYGVALTDAIFPIVPSESLVIATSTLWAKTGLPLLPLIWIAAAAGAWSGDQIGYTIGTRINIHKVPGLRGPRGVALLERTEHALERRGTSFIIAARFIPGGRIAVNLTAGALRYPRRRFMGVAGIAAVIWATYSVALGVFAGNLVESNLFVSVAIGVLGGVAIGVAVDALLSRLGVTKPDLPDIDEIPPPKKLGKKRRARLEDGHGSDSDD